MSGCSLGSQDELTCDPAPVLAAGPTLALTCLAEISYEGEDYQVGCARVHETRVGAVFEHGGGETRYGGGRRIRGVPIERLFILVGRKCEETKRYVAHGDGATEEDYRLVRSQFGARGGKAD